MRSARKGEANIDRGLFRDSDRAKEVREITRFVNGYVKQATKALDNRTEAPREAKKNR